MRLRQRRRHLPAEFTPQCIVQRRPDSLLAVTVLTGQVLSHHGISSNNINCSEHWSSSRYCVGISITTLVILSAKTFLSPETCGTERHLDIQTLPWSSSSPLPFPHHHSSQSPYLCCEPIHPLPSHYHSRPVRSWIWGSPSGGSDGKQSACNGLGRSPGEQNGYPLQYPCLEIPMDRGTWRAIVQGVTKSRT